jgi:VWFA-related protein
LKRLIASLLIVVNPVSLLAQAQPSQQSEGKLFETVSVRVINVDVVVTDRKGNPVHGLTANDFEVLENRVPQKITNFYEVRSNATVGGATTGAPASAAVAQEPTPDHLKRKIVFFVDNLSLAPFNRNRVFSSMKKFADEVLRPGDEAMIATWNRSMKVRLPFTSDPKQIQQQLDIIAGESAMGLQNISERRSVESQIREARDYTSAVSAARQYAQSVEHDLRQTVSALNGLLGTLAGVEGKKILVLTSEGLPIQPGKEMFFFIDELKAEKQWSSGSSLIEGMGFESSNLIQSIARTANANGITVYALHAGGLAASNEGSAENARPISSNVSQAAVSNSTDSLHLIADLTGGLATVGTNNFSNAFAKINRDLDSYYSIGYRSGTERVDRQRSVEVRPKNRNHVVRSRRSFVEKSIPSEMTDRVIANLFYDSRANDMKISVITRQPVQIDDGRFRVPVEVIIPMESLTLLPQGDGHRGAFTVFVVVADKNGDMSDVAQRNQAVTVPLEDIGKIGGKHFTYSVDLVMERGRNKISVGVVDEVSNSTGFSKLEVLAQDLR